MTTRARPTKGEGNQDDGASCCKLKAGVAYGDGRGSQVEGTIQLRPRGSRTHKRGAGSMDTYRIGILPARFGDATDTPIDGRGTSRIHPELSPEQQSDERELVAS